MEGVPGGVPQVFRRCSGRLCEVFRRSSGVPEKILEVCWRSSGRRYSATVPEVFREAVRYSGWRCSGGIPQLFRKYSGGVPVCTGNINCCGTEIVTSGFPEQVETENQLEPYLAKDGFKEEI